MVLGFRQPPFILSFVNFFFIPFSSAFSQHVYLMIGQCQYKQILSTSKVVSSSEIATDPLKVLSIGFRTRTKLPDRFKSALKLVNKKFYCHTLD
ncbi:hypothetical protein EDC94DRAFT_606829 [Helicostylum pulchrum]|nr:hypothetical protein EDC94DRAFT_606829 [Helicostylum pulchrum]